MIVSYRWLRELAPTIQDPPGEVAARLATLGAPPEDVVALDSDLDDIVIGRVREVRRHPDADRLSVCVVEAGGESVLDVVCGAQNVRAGGFYPFAPVGASLPGGVRIGRARIRGQSSEGMLCSPRELGLGHDHAGLLELHGDFEPGAAFVAATGLDDVRLTLEITANRPDLLSHIGVARELAPGGEADLVLPPVGGLDEPLASALRFERGEHHASAGGVRIRIEDPDACPRYLGILIRDVRVGPSPAWLATRLRAIGQRPINNVVDATNYVLHELGQPLHAFDLARLHGPEILVRTARAGETIRTLDGEDRELAGDMLVIADADGPVAVAGVMGGEESEVSPSTRDVVLECALFEPGSIRATRRALGLSTEASYRFERGVDPDGVERAARRAAALVAHLSGGRVADVAADVHPRPHAAVESSVRPARVGRVLGVPFDAADVRRILEPLGLALIGEEPDALRFRIPGHRAADLAREVDLIEEVARRHGYDRFPATLGPFRTGVVPDDPLAALQERLRSLLVGQGFLEARTLPFATEQEGDVVVQNPLSATEGRLRRAILLGLLHRTRYNFARGRGDVRLFELGTVFAPAPDEALPAEETRLGIVLAGPRTPPHWSGAPEMFDVWDLKGLLAAVTSALGCPSVQPWPWGAGAPGGERLRPPEGFPFDPAAGFNVMAGGELLAWGGQIRADALDAPAWAPPVFGVEARLAGPVYADAAGGTRYLPLPAHPAIERDLALVVPESVPAARVEEIIARSAGELLEEVHAFDLYRGSGVPQGARSIAYRLRFRAADRTLTDREADDAVAEVLQALEEIGVHRR